MSEATERARKYFKDSGISYSDITKEDIDELMILININLSDHKKLPMILRKKADFKFENNTFKHCYMYVDGEYFDKREAISFEKEEWIGFCGWSSSGNEKPFVDAFIEWCDYKVGR